MKWFRLYTEIIDDTKLMDLSDREFRLFINFLCLASEQEKGGEVSLCMEKLAWRVRTSVLEIESILQKLSKLKIISLNGESFKFLNWEKRQFKSDKSTDRWRKWYSSNVCQTLDTPFVKRCQNQNTESESETENTINTLSGISPQSPADENCPHKKIVELYHSILPELPKVRMWDATRRGLLRARWNYSEKTKRIEWWKEFFEYIKQSDFLMGKKSDWRADLPWIIKANNFAKIVDGRYHR